MVGGGGVVCVRGGGCPAVVRFGRGAGGGGGWVSGWVGGGVRSLRGPRARRCRVAAARCRCGPFQPRRSAARAARRGAVPRPPVLGGREGTVRGARPASERCGRPEGPEREVCRYRCFFGLDPDWGRAGRGGEVRQGRAEGGEGAPQRAVGRGGAVSVAVRAAVTKVRRRAEAGMAG